MASPLTSMAISSIRQPYPADKRKAFSRRGAADKLWTSTESVAENHDKKVTCTRTSTVRITSLFSTLDVSHLIGASPPRLGGAWPPWLGGAGHGGGLAGARAGVRFSWAQSSKPQPQWRSDGRWARGRKELDMEMRGRLIDLHWRLGRQCRRHGVRGKRT